MKDLNPNLVLLAGGLLVFSGLITFVGLWVGLGKELFSYLSGIGTGFSGALFAVMQITKKAD